MKEYIRTTHNFDNNTRRWVYRGERGMDKYELWNSPEIRDKCTWRDTYPFYSLGVHALKDYQWMGIEWIVDETIKEYKGDAAGNKTEFEKFINETLNYREIIKRDILEELDFLISIDMVRVNNKPDYVCS
jgi:hypothetical protein